MVTSMEYTRIQATLSLLALPRVSLCRYLFLSATRFWWEGFSDGSNGKESACNTDMQEAQVRSLGQEYPQEREMATHSSTLAWEIPWTEELGGLQSMGLQRVRYDCATEHRWDVPDTQLPGPTCTRNEQVSIQTVVIGSGLNI